MNPSRPLISSCASMMALYISSSETSFAPASIMTIFCIVAATVSSSVLSSRCALVGLMTGLPSTMPTKTPPIGPFHGISEMERAMDAPIIPAISCEQSGSTAMTVSEIATSLRRSFGNRGRIGRSMTREVRMAFSPGRPSRRRNPPGILPAAYILSSKSTERGRKSMPSRGFSDAVAHASTTVSP